MSSKSVDGFVRKNKQWQAELGRLVTILRSTPLAEEVKWGMPCYTYKGKHVVGVGAFKSYFGLWFHQGALLDDDAGVLMNAQEGRTRAQRQWRMASAKEIKATVIKRYVKQAMALVDDGVEIKAARKKPLVIAEELARALRRTKGASAAFSSLSLSCRREYSDYVAEAVRPETKERRIAKILPMILAGSGLNDRYK